ncbi:MAG: response regulator transcription factor [Gallionellaceae bacterium]|nr:response regulator transcription factor [Gallionellaceae bacterium]MDD5367164.1 response regulator transcription factor [Gallionellaceae bacterium]
MTEKINVLLADDHTIIRDGLKQIFADTQDIVAAGEAANGIQVMQQVRERDFDILLLDISMPGRNGLDLIRSVKAEKPGLPILVLSMHQEEQFAVRALHAGASGYLTKESDSDVLVSAIRRVAAGGVYFSQKVAELMVQGLHTNVSSQRHEQLSDREYQVFVMIVEGKGLTEIAGSLSLSVKTVSTHKTHILQKMGFSNANELVRYAIAHHLVQTF